MYKSFITGYVCDSQEGCVQLWSDVNTISNLNRDSWKPRNDVELRAFLGPLTAMKRTNHRLDSNSHHTTHMKEESKGEMAITLISRGPVSTEFLFSFTVSSSTGKTTMKPWNVGPGIHSRRFPRSSDHAKINSTYNSGACPVLLCSGNA